MKHKNTIANAFCGATMTLTSVFNAAPAKAEDCRPSQQILQAGEASYYADYFHGRTTANGEKFNMYAMTAASRTLPFGTRVLVNYEGREVVVRINDRGPYVGKRIIDLSKGAAQRIGMVNDGVGRVTLKKCL